MIFLESEIQSLLRNILVSRKDVTYLACQQRAKFEGWLKFELASALHGYPGIQAIIVEDCYATSGRSDISFQYGEEKWFIEMKTANTNWRAENLENLHRPITKNMTGIIEDIMVLREKCAPAHGIAVFCIFPIPFYLWKNTREKLDYHLRSIEGAGMLPQNTLIDGAQFVEISEYFGICTFVAAVV
ncbi:MAG: hypothetical protein ACOYZ6_00190 [Chloroflexota bacterium]